MSTDGDRVGLWYGLNPAVMELVVWKLVGNITGEKYKSGHKEVGIEMVTRYWWNWKEQKEVMISGHLL
jgi:hypothetical protein